MCGMAGDSVFSADPYEKCPVYETANFLLRLVRLEDADDLLECYSNPEAVALMNCDRCSSDFHYTNMAEMKECIALWLSQYADRSYVRFSIVDKSTSKAVGTAEIFGGDYGVLRIDIKPEFEERKYLSELLRLADSRFPGDFGARRIIMKAIPEAYERLLALRENGYIPDHTFRPGLDYYVNQW